MQRKIGKFETAPAVANDFAAFNLVGVLKLENAPSPEKIQNALDTLQNHHPALHTRIKKSGSSYYFQPIQDRQIPLKVIQRTHDNQWTAEVEYHMNTPTDWRSGPLLACTFLQGSQVSDLIFAFHHSIIDAISMVSFLDDFLDLCAGQQSSESVNELDGYDSLPPVEELFPPAFRGIRMNLRTFGFMARQMASEIAIMRKTRGMRTPPIQVHTTAKVLTMALSKEETIALQKSARKHKVTLNSMQHAAMLLATWKHLYHREPRPLKYILFQNLRPYLSPPVDDEVLSSYIAMIQLVIEMQPNRHFWDISKEINQAVYQAGKSGDKFVSASMSGSFLKMLYKMKSFRMAATAMNYSGSISLQETYGNIKVVDVHGFVSNFGLGPEFSAQTLIFQGKLHWNIIYLESDMNQETAQTLTEEVKQILLAQTQEAEQ
jgi:NRPS condensation-like uncharacterized protein